MSVTVGQGTAGIATGTYPSNYRYWVAIDTTAGSPAGESVTITTASASNPRIDTIVAYMNQGASFTTSPVNSANTGLQLAAVAGTPNASPSAPSAGTIQSAVGAGNPYIVLADVLVGTSVTQINSGNITDRRTMATINASKNISFPTVQSYTPTWTASTTNPSIGNGTLSGEYIQTGKLVTFWATITAGSTTTFGSGDYRLSYPVTPASNSGKELLMFGTGRAIGSSTNVFIYPGHRSASTSYFEMFYANNPSNPAGFGNVTHVSPYSWGSSSVLTVTGTYRAA